jgi:hypothetical protein
MEHYQPIGLLLKAEKTLNYFPQNSQRNRSGRSVKTRVLFIKEIKVAIIIFKLRSTANEENNSGTNN